MHYCCTQALPMRLILSEGHVVLRYECEDITLTARDNVRPSVCRILWNLLILRHLIRRYVILNFKLIYQLNAIEYLLCTFSSTYFGLTRRSSGAIEFIISFTNAAYGVLGVVRCRSWAVCVLHTHSSRPTPNYTKDTICCICKEIITSIAPEDGRVSLKHVELKVHK